MTDEYKDEKSGQLDFYNTFLPRINNNLKIEDIISDNNDGVINGNLLEFKLHITNLDIVLFQCIKYLSSLRIKGKPVPSDISDIFMFTIFSSVSDSRFSSHKSTLL